MISNRQQQQFKSPHQKRQQQKVYNVHPQQTEQRHGSDAGAVVVVLFSSSSVLLVAEGKGLLKVNYWGIIYSNEKYREKCLMLKYINYVFVCTWITVHFEKKCKFSSKVY